MTELIDETQQHPELAEQLISALDQLMHELQLSDYDVTVVLCDDEHIQQLNRDHRGVDAPTDVLSYPLMEPEDMDMPTVFLLGDIIISVDTAAAQARMQQHTLAAEVMTLAAHGLTHLLGYDHETSNQEDERWTIFHKHQKRILELANH